MTTDQILAAVGDFASFAAATAAMAAAWGTFRTVRQVQQQTIASYRPTLAFAQSAMTASAEGQGWPIPSHWTKGRASDTQISTESGLYPIMVDPTIRLYNIGLGPAANVHIVWAFPVAEFVEKINNLAQRALVPAYFESNSRGVSCKSELWPTTQFSCGLPNEQAQDIDYIMPESTNKNETLVTIPYAIVFIISAYFYFAYIQKDDDDVNEDSEILSIDILSNAAVSYSDIGGDRYDARFVLEFHPRAMMRVKEEPLTVWFDITTKTLKN
jgi:hypothetical protein